MKSPTAAHKQQLLDTAMSAVRCGSAIGSKFSGLRRQKCESSIKFSQAWTDHGIKHQAEVSPVLKGALQLDAVPPPQLVRICQLAQYSLLRLQAEERDTGVRYAQRTTGQGSGMPFPI